MQVVLLRRLPVLLALGLAAAGCASASSDVVTIDTVPEPELTRPTGSVGPTIPTTAPPIVVPTTAAPTTATPTTTAPATTTTPATTAPATTVAATSPGPTPAPPTPSDPDDVVLIGDSVAYGAQVFLRAEGIRVDARQRREFDDVAETIDGLEAAGRLRDHVMIHVGTNGEVTADECDEAVARLEGRRVTLVTVYAPGWTDWEANNAVLVECAARHSLELRDWAATAEAHPEWFFSDQRHLDGARAARAYAQFLVG